MINFNLVTQNRSGWVFYSTIRAVHSVNSFELTFKIWVKTVISRVFKFKNNEYFDICYRFLIGKPYQKLILILLAKLIIVSNFKQNICLQLFRWDPWYTRQNALYSIDPIQTREWACKITKGPFEPFFNWILGSLEVAWQHTEQSHAMTQNPFKAGALHNRKPKPQRGYLRVPHQAPPWLFLYPISNHKQL